ncbi:hypothetical protein GGR57DRAFT_511764 [Xylariaceae sp. FL1272]|nr:hypothetical protein GGR57DRAFT_511764 [Xylariaceae sp. FL1272]
MDHTMSKSQLSPPSEKDWMMCNLREIARTQWEPISWIFHPGDYIWINPAIGYNRSEAKVCEKKNEKVSDATLQLRPPHPFCYKHRVRRNEPFEDMPFVIKAYCAVMYLWRYSRALKHWRIHLSYHLMFFGKLFDRDYLARFVCHDWYTVQLISSGDRHRWQPNELNFGMKVSTLEYLRWLREHGRWLPFLLEKFIGAGELDSLRWWIGYAIVWWCISDRRLPSDLQTGSSWTEQETGLKWTIVKEPGDVDIVINGKELLASKN